MKHFVAFLVVTLASSLAYANTGVFEGSGHTIKLVRSEDVQMQSEEVTITPGRGPFLFDGGVPGMDRVEYRCKFVLHNRSEKVVTIQVGFPLSGDSFRPFKDGWRAEDATDLVLRYKFIARDKEKTYHVRFVPSDESKELVAIFLWDMTFKGDEVCNLNVAYEIPMAMALSTTEKKDWKIKYAKPWYPRLVTDIVEDFEYVTVTGQSWAGPIESAKFRLNVAGFERYLNDRFIFEKPSLAAEERAAAEKAAKERATALEKLIEESKTKDRSQKLRDLLSNNAWGSLFDWRIKDRLIRRDIAPDGWKEKDGAIVWEFNNYRPKDAIQVGYSLTILPKNPEDIPSFVKLLLDNKPSKEDLSDLREIYLAWWGIAPKSESVRRFVSNQRWYRPKGDMTAEKLTVEQKAVISAIERYSSIQTER